MRKLIKVEQRALIECDNPQCDFVIPNEEGFTPRTLKMFINQPCPKCEENLLTEKDYKDYIKVHNFINWINKWFSWLTIFQGKVKEEDYTSYSIKIHDGVHIKKEE